MNWYSHTRSSVEKVKFISEFKCYSLPHLYLDEKPFHHRITMGEICERRQIRTGRKLIFLILGY